MLIFLHNPQVDSVIFRRVLLVTLHELSYHVLGQTGCVVVSYHKHIYMSKACLARAEGTCCCTVQQDKSNAAQSQCCIMHWAVSHTQYGNVRARS